MDALLDAAGRSYRFTEELLVVDAPPEEVGELAAEHGVVLHGLAATADLEQAFFRIVQDVENLSTPIVGTGS